MASTTATKSLDSHEFAQALLAEQRDISVYAIAKALNEAGYRTANGKIYRRVNTINVCEDPSKGTPKLSPQKLAALAKADAEAPAKTPAEAPAKTLSPKGAKKGKKAPKVTPAIAKAADAVLKAAAEKAAKPSNVVVKATNPAAAGMAAAAAEKAIPAAPASDPAANAIARASVAPERVFFVCRQDTKTSAIVTVYGDLGRAMADAATGNATVATTSDRVEVWAKSNGVDALHMVNRK